MNNKIVEFVMILLLSALCVIAAVWYVLYGNVGLMLIHFMLAIILFSYIPRLLSKRDDYRLVFCVVEILIGFMGFTWIYLNTSSEVNAMVYDSLRSILLFDFACMVGVGAACSLMYSDCSHRSNNKHISENA